MNISVIIAAAGKGKRMGAEFNKQYLYLEGAPVLLRTLNAFDDIDNIDEILVVIGENELEIFRDEVLINYKFKHKIRLVKGGKERQHSVLNGLLALKENTDIVVIHDGARPLVTKKLIENSIECAKKNNACVVGVPVKDTIKVVNRDNCIKDTPERSCVWAAQTPQTFTYDLILNAHLMAKSEGFLGTDDAMLVERLGYDVKMILGSYDNIKMTTPQDLLTAEQILRRR